MGVQYSGSTAPFSHLFLKIPHFMMESAEVFGDLSFETLILSSKMSSISDSGHHIPIPGTAVWPFSSTLGIHQDYDRDQNAGKRDGHQSLSVPGRLPHLFTISGPVPPRHCTSAQSLPCYGPPHS